MDTKVIEKRTSDLVYVFKDTEIVRVYRSQEYVELFDQLSKKDENITLDFRNVEIIDSTCIGNLISLSRKLFMKKKKLKLMHLNAFILKVLRKLNLIKFFNVELEKETEYQDLVKNNQNIEITHYNLGI